MIEKSLEEAGKIVDVKYEVEQLANTKARRDTILYKMHGDIDHPHKTVLTKDDYEKYPFEKEAFMNALSGDLVSKTFLFIGFSFTDPNLEYVLSRVRIRFKTNQRQHYCFMKRYSKKENESQVEFEHYAVRQELFIQDLMRFNIDTLVVNDYAEITTILKRIESKFKRRTIFVSGSAVEYGEWGKQATDEFLYTLGKALIDKDFKITTGLGLGIGNQIISGAIESIYTHRKGHIEDRLIMRPFPQTNENPTQLKMLWEDYRQDILARAGIAIFLFGNKLENNKIANADGVKREFEIAYEQGLKLLPIGCSGYMAKELWTEIIEDFKKFYPEADDIFEINFKNLGEKTNNPQTLIPTLFNLISHLSEQE